MAKKTTLPERLQTHYDNIDFTGKGSIISKIRAYCKGKSLRVYSDAHNNNRTVNTPLITYDKVFYVNYVKNYK